MFYECDPGPAAYESPDGPVRGEITLKRQFKIRGGKMQFMFDSSAAVDDDILGRALSENAQGQLKVIIESIQREQNRAIRDEGRGDYIIFGPAGSGKTSVGVHRLAWLLYRFRERLSSKNLLTISRSNLFASYIAGVLPAFGRGRRPGCRFRRNLS
jgi:DNA helicase-2/ATP-dependent DNA helicase PcrA